MVKDAPRRRPTSMFFSRFRFPIRTLSFGGTVLRLEADRLREEFTREKRDELLTTIEEGAGNSKTLRAQAELTYYLTMFQVNSAERGTRQMAIGTWVLAVATIGLFVATIVLAVFTAKHGG
jgi:hypothetical protein